MRAPAVASMVLLPLTEFGIGPQAQIGCHELSTAAHSLVEVAVSAPRVEASAAGAIVLAGLVPRNGGAGRAEDRIEALGGTFAVHSPLGRGTTVSCELPIAVGDANPDAGPGE